MNFYEKTFQFTLKCGIGLYQKFISPYKGFHCAHRIHTHGMSCSTYGLFVVKRYKPLEAISMIKERLKACHIISLLYKDTTIKSLRSEHGAIDCDISCGDIDNCTPDFDSCSSHKSNKNCFNWTNCIGIYDCYPFDNNKKNNTFNFSNTTNKKKNTTETYNVKKFILLDEDDEYKIYKHTSERFFKINKKISTLNEKDILNGNEPYSQEVNKKELKDFFNNKK